MVKIFRTKELNNFRFSYLFLGVFIVVSIFSFITTAKLGDISKKIAESRTASLSKANILALNFSPATAQDANSPAKTEPEVSTPEVWGISTQVDEKTWSIKVHQDNRMATAKEILEAVNYYRKQKGVKELTWSEKLAELAQKRAEVFASTGKLDNHRGFNDYFKNKQNLTNIGFSGVGENSSYGYRLLGVHLVEWIFAGDGPHEQNQTDPSWSYIGVGVSGTAVDIIFAK